MSTAYRLGRSNFRTYQEGIEKEWLLTNGIGGFANHTIIDASSRIHSGYLVAALNPPVDRRVILSDVQERININGREYDFASQEYLGEIRKGYEYLNRFELDIVPTYTYQAEDVVIKKTVGLSYGKNTCTVCYEIVNGMNEAKLLLTPLFNGRNLSDTSEKSQLAFGCSFETFDKRKNHKYLSLTPKFTKDFSILFYTSEGEFLDRSRLPVSMATPNYLIEENQVYGIDVRNGFKGVDNHSTPYDIEITLKPYEEKKMYLVCSLEVTEEPEDGFEIIKCYKERIHKLMDRASIENELVRKLAWSADSFIVKRNSTGLKTILAGYPWFLDWGRDTMIALQGLTLATKRFEDARSILESFAYYVSEGMLPNVFPNNPSEQPMYNTIDASLWYFYSVDRYLSYTGEPEDYQFIYDKIYPKLKEVIKAYQTGTRFHIHMDVDGLIVGGGELDQLTWMDVRVGDWVVTPRHGKAVEINALWYNALCVMEKLSVYFKEDGAEYKELAKRVKVSYENTFWNSEKNCLYDVVSDYGKEDNIRPNQIWAVSLPYTMLSPKQEKQIVDVVYQQLYTPYGIRSLSNRDNSYKSQYIGRLIDRDGAYHMGTAWGYIMGAFITAYCKVHNYDKKYVERAKEMCEYLEDHMQDGCLNGIAEIFDGDFSNTSRGCYSQAWSVGELLRAYTEDIEPYL